MKPTAWIFSAATVTFVAGIAAVTSLSWFAPPTAQTADKTYRLSDVARHAKPEDCWMVIDGQVYDFTTYIAQHPTPPAILTAWCGKEATQAYRTKNVGRAHSPYADSHLPKYRIGVLDL